ncbi:MAG: hypothetical protein E7192_07345 [Erysipelotrichaceae bacterium]|nr:hypothetical protein [Erysipelotrichaceae bacterium]
MKKHFYRLSLIGCFSLRCNHEETVTRIVANNDFSKNGMVEIVCKKCGKVFRTEMIDQIK